MTSGSVPVGSALIATGRGRVLMRDIYKAPTLRQAKALADQALEQCESHWEIADMIGSEDTREIIPNRKTFDDKPSEVTRKRAADLIVARWKGRKERELLERVKVLASDTLAKLLSDSGIDATAEQCRQRHFTWKER